jgi:hypothetical protein
MIKVTSINVDMRRVVQLDRVVPQLTAAMEDFAAAVHNELATYPPRKHVSIEEAGGWASDKQRRWFFWALKHNIIEVPYKRTGTLGRSWQHKVAKETDAVIGVVGSQGQIAPYNIYVQGEQQTPMMVLIGWKRPIDIYKPHWRKLIRQAEKIVSQAAR